MSEKHSKRIETCHNYSFGGIEARRREDAEALFRWVCAKHWNHVTCGRESMFWWDHDQDSLTVMMMDSTEDVGEILAVASIMVPSFDVWESQMEYDLFPSRVLQ